MHVVRCGDIQGVDVVRLLSHQFAPVLIDAHFRPALLHPAVVFHVRIAHGHEFELRMIRKGTEVRISLPAHADRGVPDFAIRRRSAQIRDEGRSKHSRASPADESAPGAACGGTI